MIKLGIIGLGHAFFKQLDAIKQTNELELIAVCDCNKQKLDRLNMDIYKTTNYKKLLNICDYVLIASPPSSHYKIAKYFIKNSVNILQEKPIVITSKQLDKLQYLVNKYNVQFYNLLHFSFGEEILWYKTNKKPAIPEKIKVFISDKYCINNHIMPASLSLNGAYLDETINPLSALAKLFGYNLVFKELQQKYFKKDRFDYYSLSQFEIGNTNIEIEVDWAKNIDDKYIDLIYEDKIVRLDSMGQKVIDMKKGKVIFSATGDRMTNHYKNAFNDFLKTKHNLTTSIFLHKELLKNL